VRLPPGVFNPYAGVNTNLLFFTKGEPTKEVWYYQMQLPAGLRAYTKTKPITDREFEVVKEWWNDRVENNNAWKVSIEDIKAKNWNLDVKNPKGGEVEEEVGSKELVERILGKEEKIKDLLKNL
jgi:type I restriction enzyme M protein